MKKYLTKTNINITYISNNMAKSTAQMILIRGIHEHCTSYDPLGMDTVIDCFNCKNSEFRIIDDENNILVDFKTLEKVGKLIINHGQEEIKSTIQLLAKKDKYKKTNLEYETYNIQFFENYDHQNIINYLKKKNSNYRLIRMGDNRCIRFSHIEKRLNDEKKKKANEAIEKYIGIYMDDSSKMTDTDISTTVSTRNREKKKTLVRKTFKTK